MVLICWVVWLYGKLPQMVTYNPAKFIGYVVYGYIRYMV